MFNVFYSIMGFSEDVQQFIDSNPQLFEHLVKRSFEGAIVLYVLFFFGVSFLLYKVFKNFWRA